MKIKEMQTFNFRGLSGVKTFKFEDLMVILQKNATGKSSFIDALIYGLSGIEPAGEMINSNASECGVQITFEDGTKYIRMCQPGKNKYIINKKTTTKKVFEESLANACGVNMDVIKVVTSSDVIRAMKPSKLSDFLLHYTGEKLTMQTLIDAINDKTCTDDMKSMANNIAAKLKIPDKFGIDVVDILYKEFYEYRKRFNAEAQNAEAKYTVFCEQSKDIPEDADEKTLLEEKAHLEKEREKLSAYQAEFKSYKNELQRYENDCKAIKALEEQISAMPSTENMSDEEYGMKKKLMSENIVKESELRETASQTIASLRISKDTMEKAYHELESSKCPLSDRIICTTDKTVIRDELKVAIESLTQQITAQENVYKRHKEEEKNLTETLHLMEENRVVFSRKRMLESQMESLKKNLKAKPEEPKKPLIEDISRIRDIDDILLKMKARENAKAMETIKDTKKRYHTAFDGLVQAFAPKGIIKRNIMLQYLQAFADECNKVAVKLNSNMKFKFESDNNGIFISVDMNGDGTYLRYESLSGGEKCSMILVLMTMLNTLTGFSIIIMDELSVLDSESYGAIVDLLNNTKNTRDHAIIAAVNHSDTVREIKKKKISLYGIG